MHKNFFMAQYGDTDHITHILNNSEYDSDARTTYTQDKNYDIDMTHELALTNPKATVEHARLVLKYPHNFGSMAKTAAIKHPDLTKDDLEKAIAPFHTAISTRPWSIPEHISRAMVRLKYGEHRE